MDWCRLRSSSGETRVVARRAAAPSSSSARLASTSLTFMLVLVPAPPCRRVHDDVLDERAIGQLAAGALDGVGLGRVVGPGAERAIGPRAGQLHGAVGADEFGMNRPAGEREILQRARRVNAVQRSAGTAARRESRSMRRSSSAHVEPASPSTTRLAVDAESLQRLGSSDRTVPFAEPRSLHSRRPVRATCDHNVRWRFLPAHASSIPAGRCGPRASRRPAGSPARRSPAGIPCSSTARSGCSVP